VWLLADGWLHESIKKRYFACVFSFDQHGYLTPYEVIPTTMVAFEATFVLDRHRENLYQQLLNFILDVKKLDIGAFYIWVDGSFVTMKRTPGDIDLVVFFSPPDYRIMTHHLHILRKAYKDTLDIFIVEDFPETHKNRWISILEKTQWQEMFCHDRTNRPKGIIQLNFSS
jgi:hypothetical protein